MNRLPAVLVSAFGLLSAADPSFGQPPPNNAALILPVAPPPTPFRLGVGGEDTNHGYRVTSVLFGSRATQLGPKQNISLESGDWITEVNGRKIDMNWTLPQAIAASNGIIDMTFWDCRGKCFLTYTGVHLDRK